jgi:hypothetical protein
MGDVQSPEGSIPEGQREFLDREVAEVYLLLDFLSGRADRSLRPTEEEHARALLERDRRSGEPDRQDDADSRKWQQIDADLCDPTRLVFRTMRIKYPVRPDDADFEANSAFLIRARDVLNTRAWPATGTSIAFTSMVTDGTTFAPRPRSNTTRFAQTAYPYLAGEAARLAKSIRAFGGMLVIGLAVAVGLSAYTAWGKVMLDTLDAIRRDDSAVRSEFAAATAHAPANLCANSATRLPICDSKDDIEQRYRVTIHHLATWELPLRWESAPLLRWARAEPVATQVEAATPAAPESASPASDPPPPFSIERKRVPEWATAVVTVVGNYLMPSLYGMLGSIAFVLRRYHDRLAAHLLTPRDRNVNRIRLLLGVLIGASIGLVYSGSAAAQTSGILGAAVTLSTSAIAFLAGYGVEAVFKALDMLVTQVFHVNGTDRQAQRAG